MRVRSRKIVAAIAEGKTKSLEELKGTSDPIAEITEISLDGDRNQ